jgi:hypothetical protein
MNRLGESVGTVALNGFPETELKPTDSTVENMDGSDGHM